MCSKSRGKKQDARTMCALVKRERKRAEVNDRKAAKELGMSYTDYMSEMYK